MKMVQMMPDGKLELPQELLDGLALHPGDRLAAEVDAEGRLVLTPVRDDVLREPAPIWHMAGPDKQMVRVREMDFAVVIEPDKEDGGYVVGCPTLPGCWSQGETVEEAIQMIADAISGCLAVRIEQAAQASMARARPDAHGLFRLHFPVTVADA